MTTVEAAPHPRGLSAAEVSDRVARGLTNDLPEHPTRTTKEIVRANVFTYFNLLLGGLLVVILVVGPLNDALFGGVIVANTLVGVIQEVRAKRTLDKLAVLSTPRATVRREGDDTEVAVREVVLDDLLVLRPGDQIVVDGTVVEVTGLEVDESLLTGESDPVVKAVGDTVQSGSFVAAGGGVMRATRVGRDAYASQVAEEARRFTLARSELRSGIDWIVRLVSYLMIPTGGLLLFSQITGHAGIADALRATVAGVVAMVPEGLVLLTSVAFALGVVRLGKRRVLVQELPAIETLARVDVICLDKTGTITRGELTLAELVATDGASAPGADAIAALAAVLAADPNPNATLRALHDGLASRLASDAPSAAPTRAVPFSSARKWSAASLTDGSTWVLGAPDVILRQMPGTADLAALIERRAAEGFRLVLLARSDEPLVGETLPAGLVPQLLAILQDEVRPDAPDTLRYFAEQGVAVKIISGDHPTTVAAVVRRAGLDVEGAIDASTLPSDVDGLADALEGGSVFGRVTPQQKRAMVKALQARSHVVAMTGDGVNDVLALKDADIGIAMGSGSAASRSAAQLVLLDGTFASLPPVVGEGRRVIANVERVANLFLTKTVYSMLLALAVGVVGLPFPFLPRHLTLVGTLTIGTPAFILALAPNSRRALPHFVARVFRFAAPCGLLAAAATFTAYYVSHIDGSLTLDQQRTTATLVLVALGLLILIQLASPLNPQRRLLVAAMATGFCLVLALPGGRTYFALSLPPLPILVGAIGLVAISAWIMLLATRVVELYRAPYQRLLAGQQARQEREASARAARNEETVQRITAPRPVGGHAAAPPSPAPDHSTGAPAHLPPPPQVPPGAPATTMPLPPPPTAAADSAPLRDEESADG